MDGTGAPSFEEAVLRQGLVSPAQLDECRRLRDNVVAQGLDCTLEEVLLKKNLLTKAQVSAVHAAIGQGNKTAIEGYEILVKLGSGGQGAVYKARQTSMDRLVAIKVLSPKYAKDKDGVQRFIREARAIAKLNHPNIVSGIDAGYSNGIYYYAMEYVEGTGLERQIARQGKLPWSEAVSILRQVGAALEHANQNGLVHRDIKPSNILLTRDGTAKLMDLGMARFAGQEGMTLTQTGCVVGTPFYMAPEQARGEEKVDIRADLYSLGITLYEMLAGKPPYTGSEALVVLNRHLKETVRFAFADAPPELLAIGHRLTERDRARRYATPAELLEDLEALEADRPLEHARSAVRPRTSRISTIHPRESRSRAPVLIGAAGAVLALVIGVAIALPGKPPPPPPRIVVAAPPPAPAPLPAPAKTPVPEAETKTLTEAANVREYERAHPEDLEEIAARYADLVGKTAGTVEGERVKARSAETKDALDAAMKKRQAASLAEVAGHLAARRYGAALEALDRSSRLYRSPEWKRWHEPEARKVQAGLDEDARRLRDASLAAERNDDYAGAAAPMRELQGFGVGALAAEAAQRIKDLEATRARKSAAEAERLEAFLDQADAWAAERAYEKIGPAAPDLKTEPSKSALSGLMLSYRGAQDVLATAIKHLAGLRDRTVEFRQRGGARVSGHVTAIVDQPFQLVIGGKAYAPNAIAPSSLADFYRKAKGPEASAAHVVLFAVFEGDSGLAEETMRRTPVELHPRHKEMLRRAAEEARKPPAEAPPPAAKKEPAAGPRKEIVVYASDLPKDALDSFEFWNETASPGGRMLGVTNDGDIKDAPPKNDDHALVKVPVQAGIPYRCWIHMKVGAPKGQSQANVLWVQFTGAVDKAGKDLYPVGTGNYLTVRGPAREGWLWVGKDLSDPKATEPLIFFKTPGEATVRIAAGHEGVGFDQVVLSPARYLEKPPAEAVVPQPKP